MTTTKQDHIVEATRLADEASRWLVRDPQRAAIIAQLAQVHATIAQVVGESRSVEPVCSTGLDDFGPECVAGSGTTNGDSCTVSP